MSNYPLAEISEMQGVIGCVACDASGLVKECYGDEAELLGSVLGYFQQLTDLIGEALGLDPLEEAHVMGKSVTAVCLPGAEDNVGVVFQSRARVAETIQQIRQIK